MIVYASGKAESPFLRVPRGMKDGVNGHCVFRPFEEDSVWKSPDQGAAIMLINANVNCGLTTNSL
jgi:hypothetical protein